MISETGTVIALDNDGVWVETLKQSVCGQCRARHGCGQKLLASADSRFTCIKVFYGDTHPKTLPRIGDEVVIGVDELAMVKDTLFSYGLPLLCMLLALAVMANWNLAEIWMVLSAIVGLGLGGAIVRCRPENKGLKPVLLNTHL